MGDVAGKIELYHNLFRGCLILAIFCFVLAVALFFVLDIRGVIGYLTGRQKKKMVRAMEAENAASGRLMKDRSSYHAAAPDVQEELGIRQNAVPGARKVENVVEFAMEDAKPAAAKEEKGFPETDILKEETEQQRKNADTTTDVLGEGAVSRGRFFIEREIVFIHAEEII